MTHQERGLGVLRVQSMNMTLSTKGVDMIMGPWDDRISLT